MNATITTGGTTGTAPITQSQLNMLSVPITGGGFTTFGIIAAGFIFWTASQNATGDARNTINLFLFTLLASMILLNWSKIGPIFFKGGA